MPGSSTTPGRSSTRASAPARVAFRYLNGVGTRDMTSFAAQWLACALPYRRFATTLANSGARLGADAVRYSFIATDFHRLVLAGLPAHSEEVLSYTYQEALNREASAGSRGSAMSGYSNVSLCPFHESHIPERWPLADSGKPPQEEPSAGKPPARICEGESRMAELLDIARADQKIAAGLRPPAAPAKSRTPYATIWRSTTFILNLSSGPKPLTKSSNQLLALSTHFRLGALGPSGGIGPVQSDGGNTDL